MESFFFFGFFAFSKFENRLSLSRSLSLSLSLSSLFSPSSLSPFFSSSLVVEPRNIEQLDVEDDGARRRHPRPSRAARQALGKGERSRDVDPAESSGLHRLDALVEARDDLLWWRGEEKEKRGFDFGGLGSVAVLASLSPLFFSSLFSSLLFSSLLFSSLLFSSLLFSSLLFSSLLFSSLLFSSLLFSSLSLLFSLSQLSPSSLSLSLSHLPSPDPEVVGRAPVQARVEHFSTRGHRHVVSDDLEADGRFRAGTGADVTVAEPRRELYERGLFQGSLAGGVAEDLVLDGGGAGAVGRGGEGGGAVCCCGGTREREGWGWGWG